MLKALQKNFDNTGGFSIVEVVVAALIFAIAAAGFYSAVVGLTQQTEPLNQRAKAAFIGKQILEDLRTSVNAENWGSLGSNLSPKVADNPHILLPVTVDNVVYNRQYNVIDDPDGTGARRVVLNITW